MVRTALTSFLLCFSFLSSAQTLLSEDELRPFTDRVVSVAMKEGTAAAFATMKPHLLIPEGEFQSMVSEAVSQRDQFRARAGKTIGFEFFDKSRKESTIKVAYFEKAKQGNLSWMFFFSNNGTGWGLSSFHVR